MTNCTYAQSYFIFLTETSYEAIITVADHAGLVSVKLNDFSNLGAEFDLLKELKMGGGKNMVSNSLFAMHHRVCEYEYRQEQA